MQLDDKFDRGGGEMGSVVVRGVAAAGIIAVLGGGFYPTLLAQEAKSITDQEACKTMKSGAHAADKSKAPKDVAEAEQWLRNDFAQAGESEIQFNLDTGNFSYKTKNDQMFSFNLVTLAQTTLSRDAATGAWRVTFTSYDGASSWFQTRDRDHSVRFQAALQFLAAQAAQNVDATHAAALESFKLQAAAWRTLTVKPTMPDDAYSHKVLAEAAYQDKNLLKAHLEYTLALEKFPAWPEGQFNDALIAGELKAYRNAGRARCAGRQRQDNHLAGQDRATLISRA